MIMTNNMALSSNCASYNLNQLITKYHHLDLISDNEKVVDTTSTSA